MLGFASDGRRRSEIAAADWQDLRRIGEDAFIYRLEHGKTQQAGPSSTATPDKPVLGRAGGALAAWLSATDITEGPLFRRRWGERVVPALSPRAVAAIVQRRTLHAGLNGDFGGHSLRSGFITGGGRQGIALPALMALTEHRSVAQAIGFRSVTRQATQRLDCLISSARANASSAFARLPLRRSFLKAFEQILLLANG